MSHKNGKLDECDDDAEFWARMDSLSQDYSDALEHSEQQHEDIRTLIVLIKQAGLTVPPEIQERFDLDEPMENIEPPF